MFRVLLFFATALAFFFNTYLAYRGTGKLPNRLSFSSICVSLSDESVRPCPMAAKCSGQYRKGQNEACRKITIPHYFFVSDGCDGSGKIMGGIGTVAPWWPIKVYRPCPSYLEARAGCIISCIFSYLLLFDV